MVGKPIETPRFPFVAVLEDGSDKYRIYVREAWILMGKDAVPEGRRTLPKKRNLRDDVERTFQPCFIGGIVITSGITQVNFGTNYRAIKELV